MILRMIRGRGDAARLDSLRDALDAEGRRLGAQGQPLRLYVATRESEHGLQILILVFWRSAEELAAADLAGTSMLLRSRGAGIEDLVAVHFEIDAELQRPAGTRPVAVRIATGTFTQPGADIEMQDLLRERLPTVGPEMVEAYVGRRLAGRSIEVMFVSCWQREPAGLDLAAAFWTDIALRYDTFSVEVWTPVG